MPRPKNHPVNDGEIKRLAINCGLAVDKRGVAVNFGKYANAILRLIGEVQRHRRDKAARETAELSKGIAAAIRRTP